MTQEEKSEKSQVKLVKKETMFLVALIALVMGFLGGVIFSSVKSAGNLPAARPAPGQPGQQAEDHDHGPTPEQANMILTLEREVSQNPTNLEAWTQLGNIYFDTNKLDQSIRAYKKSLELNPKDPNVWTDMGVMYQRKGQAAEAIDAFEKAMAIDPRHEVSRFNKGIVLMHDLNDRDGAIQMWEEVIKINPAAIGPNGMPVQEMINNLKKQTTP